MKYPGFVDYKVKEGMRLVDTVTEIFLNQKKCGEISVKLEQLNDYGKYDIDEYSFVRNLEEELSMLPHNLIGDACLIPSFDTRDAYLYPSLD